MNTFALKGNICFSQDHRTLLTFPNSYVICENGICAGVYSFLPEKYTGITVYDYGDSLIIPGLVDLHTHASQYAFRGLGMDLELIDWLNTHTFKEEQKYKDLEYARTAYSIFVKDLQKSGTTRACVFATIHNDATLLLMDMLEDAGICAYVGKVNMDRNSPDYLCEKNAEVSASDTEKWISTCKKYNRVKPILTPRFIPTCTDELMMSLSSLQKKYGLPVQSHLSENPSEINWVSQLHPDTTCYGEAYHKFSLFGGGVPTIMAHCVHSTPEEIELMHHNQVFIAHCPQSNTNLSSGTAPVRAYLEKGIPIGLGSDIAAGHSLSIFRAMADAVQCSKLRWRMLDESLAPLKVEEAFYMATKGGGQFFDKVGSFEEGYEFDAVIIDDSTLPHPQKLNLKHRLERYIYIGDDRQIRSVFVQGKQIV